MAPSIRPAGADGESPESAEKVLVVPRADLEAAGCLPRGFAPGDCRKFLEIVERKGIFLQRSGVEEDPGLKQVIPYAVVSFEDRVFLFRRTSKGGEARLHRMYSIGVGGHINPESVPPAALVEAGLRRELEEELRFQAPYVFCPAGLINDDATEVGRVHVGIVYLVSASSPAVMVRETEVLRGGFVPRKDLAPHLDSMETWSYFVARGLFGKEIDGALERAESSGRRPAATEGGDPPG